MKLIISFFITALILLSTNVLSQEKCNKILFLDFRFIKGTPELIGGSVVDGKLKIRKDKLRANKIFSYEILSNQNKIIYSNNFDDPTQNIIEYPGENGEIKRTVIKKDSLEYSIRVPYSENISKIVLYKNAIKPKCSKSSIKSFEQKYEFLINDSLIYKGK